MQKYCWRVLELTWRTRLALWWDSSTAPQLAHMRVLCRQFIQKQPNMPSAGAKSHSWQIQKAKRAAVAADAGRIGCASMDEVALLSLLLEGGWVVEVSAAEVLLLFFELAAA
jgi:hypothetical protein